MKIDKMITDRDHESHSVRDTSILTYTWLKALGLGDKQRKVFAVIKDCSIKHIYPTDREIAEILGYSDPNKVRPRRFELMENKFIVEAGKRKCSKSGRLALTWKLPNHLLDNGNDELFKQEGKYLIQTRFIPSDQWDQLMSLMSKMQFVYVGQMKWTKKKFN